MLHFARRQRITEAFVLLKRMLPDAEVPRLQVRAMPPAVDRESHRIEQRLIAPPP